MISKELLSEVLDEYEILESHSVKLIDEYTIEFEYTQYYTDNFGTDGIGDPTSKNSSEYINIYELAHKCKEWARRKQYLVQTGCVYFNETDYDVLCIHKDIDIEDENPILFSKRFKTEPEAIFKACQWILDNKGD